MKTQRHTLILAALASGVLTTAQAATQSFVTVERALEANIDTVVLPSGPNSSLVLTPCPGCAPRSLLATAATTYFLRTQQVSLAEFKAALAGKTDIYLSVLQSTRSGELTRVVASLSAPVAAKTK